MLSDGGLIDKTKEAIAEYEKAQEKEQEELAKLTEMLENVQGGNGSTGGQGGSSSVVEGKTGPTGKTLPQAVIGTEHDNIEGEDSLGNPVVIPGGFKFAGQPTDTVEDGIIIGDDEGNQFVWIPVSNTDGDNDSSTTEEGSILIKRKGKDPVEITLGRYKFKNQYNEIKTADSPDGTPELKQKGSESNSDDDKYKFSWTLNSGSTYEDYKENTSLTRTNGGEGAKALDQFVESVGKNHGYYLARYEAGKGNDGKPVSKVGAVWNNITQPEASEAAQRMYEAEENYTSDLVNSYAWDTAIVYIQAMENDNYANANRDTIGKTSLLNTGETGDEKCHIYDMAANLAEWTTEYSTYTDIVSGNPCVIRGGSCYYSSYYTARRDCYITTDSYYYIGFRPLLYIVK